MKRILFVLGLIAIAAFTQPAYAEDMNMGNDQQQGQGMGMMMGGGKMNPMMMGMMNRPTMLATSDGGVVIMEGPRLMKYDKDLTLVKEVEMPKGKKPGPQQGEGTEGDQLPQ